MTARRKLPPLSPPELMARAREDGEFAESFLPLLAGGRIPHLDMRTVLSRGALIVGMSSITTLLAAWFFGSAYNGVIGIIGLVVHREPPEAANSLIFAGIAALIPPFSNIIMDATVNRRHSSMPLQMSYSTASEEPKLRVQADLLVQLIGYLRELPGLELLIPNPEAWSTQETHEPLIVLEYKHKQLGWVKVLPSASLQLGLITHLSPHAIAERLALNDQAQEALEALHLTMDTLGLRSRTLPDKRPALFINVLPLNLSLKRCCAALDAPPAELADDLTACAAILTTHLVQATLETTAQGSAEAALRVVQTAPPLRNATSWRATRWSLLDRLVLTPTALEPLPMRQPRVSFLVALVFLALFTALLCATVGYFTWGVVPYYWTSCAISLLVFTALHMLLLTAGKPDWGRPTSSAIRAPHLRATPKGERAGDLRLDASGVLRLGKRTLDLRSPFTIDLNRDVAAEGDTTTLHLTLLQRDAEGGVQRLTLSAQGLDLDADANALPALNHPGAHRLAPDLLLSEVWPLIADAAASHGQTPRFDLLPART